MSRPTPAQEQHTVRPAPLPLGALAAGVGLSLLSTAVLAQAVSQDNTPTESTTLPTVSVKAPRVQQAPSKENLQTVTTNVGKGQQAIRDIPQSLSVITEKLLDDVKLDTLKDTLHYTSGITFAAAENGTDQDIRLRGFSVAAVGDLMIDGMKDPSQYDRDTFNYDRVEVLRGSASMLFGRGSTGGVVNQVNKKPMLADQSDVMFTVGTGDYGRATVDFNKRTDEHAALRINAMVTEADNYGAKISKKGIAPTYSWGIGTADEFSIGLFYLDVDNTPMSNIRYLGGKVTDKTPDRFYGTGSDVLQGEATYVMGSWRHRIDDRSEIKTQVRSGRFTRVSWGSAAGYANGTTEANISNQTKLTVVGLTPRKDQVEGTYLQSDYSAKLDLLGMRHELLSGVDFAFESNDTFSAVNGVGANYAKSDTSSPYVGTDNNYTPLRTPLFKRSGGYSSQAAGVYAQDLVSLTSQWKYLAGVRWDRFKGNTESVTAATGVVTDKTSMEYGSLLSYRTGVLFQPTDSQSYHLSYGTSFNTSGDTYRYTTNAVAQLDPEKSRNIELGAKLDWLDGALSTRGALFRTEKFNERTQDADFAAQGVYLLSGKRHAQGLEIDVVGHVTDKLELTFSWTHIFEAVIDKAGTIVAQNGSRSNVTGQDVGLTPKNTASLWATYQVLSDLRVGLGARGASRNYALQGTTGAKSVNAKAPGYVAYDAMVEYKLNPDAFLQFNVANLTNKVYGDQLYPSFATLGERRSFKMTFGTRF